MPKEVRVARLSLSTGAISLNMWSSSAWLLLILGLISYLLIANSSRATPFPSLIFGLISKVCFIQLRCSCFLISGRNTSAILVWLMARHSPHPSAEATATRLPLWKFAGRVMVSLYNTDKSTFVLVTLCAIESYGSTMLSSTHLRSIFFL